MKFYMPTKLFTEGGCVKSHKEELAALGSNALIVTGRVSSKRNGSLDDVTKSLDELKTPWTLFDEVEENPSVETVVKAAKAGFAGGADFVIGVGGGSAIDAAKAAALLLTDPDPCAEILLKKDPCRKALPVAAIPTTCGTGSEVTGVSVLTYHDRRTKGSIPYRIFPQLALCDPMYLAYAPHKLIVNTALDSLAHLMESRFNSGADIYSRICADEGLKLWGECKEVLTGSKTAGRAEYEALMSASSIAGMAIAQTGTGIPHGLSYTLTYEGGIAHGRACAYFLPGYLENCDRYSAEEALELIGISGLREFAEFIRALVPEKVSPELAGLAADRLLETPAKLRSAPFEADEQTIRKIASSIL